LNKANTKSFTFIADTNLLLQS